MAYDDDLEKKEPTEGAAKAEPEPAEDLDRASILARRTKLVLATISGLAIAGTATPACEPSVCLNVDVGGYGGYGGAGGAGGADGGGGDGAGFPGGGGAGGDTSGGGGQGGAGGQGGDTPGGGGQGGAGGQGGG